MDRRKPAIIAAAATLVVLAGLATLGRQVTNRPAPPYQGCEHLLEHFPEDVFHDRVRQLPDGLFEYLLPSCETVTSHGGDPADDPGLSSTDYSSLAPLGAPVCATTDKYVLVYLRPSNNSDRYSTMAPTLRTTMKQVDGKLVAEAQNRMGASQAAHYRVRCNSDGSLYVANVVSSQSTGSATFSNLISDLQSKGFNSTSEKYLILWDGTINSSFSGQATVRNDSSDSASNSNNSGNSHAFLYGTTSASTAMHEIGHNLGAVQQDAPGAAPPGWHCDGGKDSDVMCYNDGSSGWSSTPVCGTNPTAGKNSYDHCHNQYWAPENRTGTSYAATRWNQAECYNRWMVSTWCGTVPGPTPSPTATATTTPPATQAVYDPALGAPKCATVQAVCDTGPTLVRGKDTLSGGNELNQPNTVDACTDGTTTDAGYTVDESIESVKVATTDGTAFVDGKTVKVTVSAYIFDATADHLDIYLAASATVPTWQYVATVNPTATGLQTLTATFPLSTGATQAVRTDLRYQGTASPCSTSNYDDADDLAFAVGTGPTPTPTPTTTITPTPTPTATGTGTAQCNNGLDDDGDGTIDAADVECGEDPDGDGVYVYTSTDNIESNHYGAYWQTGLAGGCTVKKVGTHDHETVSSCSTHG